MKIIQFIYSIANGGAEAVMFRLDKGFREKGVDSKIVTFIPYNNIESLNIKKSVWNIKRVVSDYINIEKPDMILVHLCDLHRIFAKIDYPNIFFIIHLDILYKYNNKSNFFRKAKFKRSINRIYNRHQTVTVSNGIRDNLLSNFKIDSSKVRVIYNPFDFENIREKAKDSIDIKGEYILHIGRFDNIKRHDILIKAFYRLANKNMKLLLLGVGVTKSKIEKLVSELNIEDQVYFLGWESNPFKYIKNAKLLVLSSSSEALPNVIIESLILNTPVVSTATIGSKEILSYDLNIFLSKIDDIEDLALKIFLGLKYYPKIETRYYFKFEKHRIIEEYLNLIV